MQRLLQLDCHLGESNSYFMFIPDQKTEWSGMQEHQKSVNGMENFA